MYHKDGKLEPGTKDFSFRLDSSMCFESAMICRSFMYYSGLSHPFGNAHQQSIDPARMIQFLDCVLLVDVLSPGQSDAGCEIRLIGTTLTQILGELTGQRLDTALPSHRFPGFIAAVERVLESSRTVRLVSDGAHGKWNRLRSESLFAPLHDDCARISRILIVVDVNNISRN